MVAATVYTLNMFKFQNRSLRLFRVWGITVFVHWSWFLVAYFFYINGALGMDADPLWGMLTYLSLFGIVLLHEFGHALACRSVGGTANTIILWPLGGIAFVSPPARPGAMLWSIAAGPLVNVVLIPVTGAIAIAAWIIFPPAPDQSLQGPALFAVALAAINASLLLFNMLPVYPLDGGQILQSILWFFIGRARSLRVAATIGIIVAAVAAVICLLGGELWLMVIAVFIGWQSWNGLRMARFLMMHEQQTNPWDAR